MGIIKFFYNFTQGFSRTGLLEKPYPDSFCFISGFNSNFIYFKVYKNNLVGKVFYPVQLGFHLQTIGFFAV